MKPQFTRSAILLALIFFTATSCAAPPTLPAPTQAPPTVTPVPEPKADPNSAVVLEMIERLNAGDLEGSLAFFSEDAMGYIVGLPPTGMEVYAGKEQMRALWQDSVDNHFQWEVEVTGVEGEEVYVQAKTWHDFTREIGVAPLEWIDVYEVKDGKIITYSTTITAEALARLKPALADIMPPEEEGAPLSNSPVSEMTVTIEAGTCTVENPITLQAGEIKATLNVLDQDNSLYALTIFYLNEDKDLLDLMASTAAVEPPSYADMLLYEELEPGQSKSYTFTIKKGPVYMICWSQPPALPIGNAGPIEVK